MVFLQKDALRGDIYTPGTLNRYTYVLNNPLNFIDPNETWSLATGGKSYGVGDINIGYMGKKEGGQTTYAYINASLIQSIFRVIGVELDTNRQEREWYGFSIALSIWIEKSTVAYAEDGSVADLQTWYEPKITVPHHF